MSNIDKQAQKELYGKVEQQAHSLRGSPREYQVLTGMCPVNVIEMQAQKIQSLLDELEAKDKRIAELEARPANPINFKENADADYCRGWAWNEVKKELASEAWTVGDNCTYYGFFCWGWDSRRQFNEQRGAGITVKGE